jgi:hypothetical protein
MVMVSFPIILGERPISGYAPRLPRIWCATSGEDGRRFGISNLDYRASLASFIYFGLFTYFGAPILKAALVAVIILIALPSTDLLKGGPATMFLGLYLVRSYAAAASMAKPC